MRRPHPVLLPAVLSVGLLAGGCSRGGQGNPAPAGGAAAPGAAARPAGPRPVQVAQPTANPWPRIVVLHGQLEARESVTIAARVEGPITRVSADLGDHVRVGRPLASISPTDYQAHLAQAEADLAQAQSDLARLEGVARPEAVSRQQVEQARTKVALAQAQRALALRQRADASIRAPFTGTVARRYISPGAFVRLGTPLFDFVSDGNLRLTLDVPERYVRQVVVGSTVNVLPDEVGSESFQAQIVRVSPVVAQGSRAFRVEAEVEPREGVLRPGMFVLGHISLGLDPDSVRVPRGAVYSVLGQDRVTIVVDGKAQPRDVELLGEDRGDALVHGLSPSDVVVLRGGAALAPGTPVRAETAAPAAPSRPSAAAGHAP